MKSITIAQASNGYIVKGEGEGSYVIHVEEGDVFPRRAECQAMLALCVDIMDYFDMSPSEHEPYNIAIQVAKATHGMGEDVGK